MRKIGMLGHLHGSSAMGLAAAILTRNNQPTEQATASRHRGQESPLTASNLAAKAARQQGKSERA